MRRLAELRDVGTGDEGAAGADDDDRPHAAVGVSGLQAVAQSQAHPVAERVDGRIVHGQNGDTAAPVEVDEGSDGCHLGVPLCVEAWLRHAIRPSGLVGPPAGLRQTLPMPQSGDPLHRRPRGRASPRRCRRDRRNEGCLRDRHRSGGRARDGGVSHHDTSGDPRLRHRLLPRAHVARFPRRRGHRGLRPPRPRSDIGDLRVNHHHAQAGLGRDRSGGHAAARASARRWRSTPT